MTPDRNEAILKRLPQLILALPTQASALGPAILFRLLGECRKNLNEATLLLQEVQQEHSALESLLSGEEATFELKHDDLLATDLAVKGLPNIADREAAIRVILRDDRSSIADLKKRAKSLAALEKVVKLTYTELKATMSDIRKQQEIAHDEIKLKTFFGNEATQADEPETSVLDDLGKQFEEEDSQAGV